MRLQVKEKRILVFGSSGVGKTTILNQLTNGSNKTSDSAIGVTFETTAIPSYDQPPVLYNGEYFRFDDTVGLNETDTGTVDNFTAFVNLKDFLKNSVVGFNLFIYVFEKGRITDSDKKNVELFCEVLAQNQVPTMMVVAKSDKDDGIQSLEDLRNNTWVNENKTALEAAFGKDTFCAFQQVAFPKPSFSSNLDAIQKMTSESKQLLMKAIAEKATDESVVIITKETVVTFLAKILNWLSKNTSKGLASIGNTIASALGYGNPFKVNVDEVEDKLRAITNKLMINFGVDENRAHEVARDIIGW